MIIKTFIFFMHLFHNFDYMDLYQTHMEEVFNEMIKCAYKTHFGWLAYTEHLLSLSCHTVANVIYKGQATHLLQSGRTNNILFTSSIMWMQNHSLEVLEEILKERKISACSVIYTESSLMLEHQHIKLIVPHFKSRHW